MAQSMPYLPDITGLHTTQGRQMIQTNPFFNDGSLTDAAAQVAGLPPALILVALIISAYILLGKTIRRRTRSWPKAFQNARTISRNGLGHNASNPDFAAANFKTIPLLNYEKARLLPIMEQILKTIAPRHRVMAQTSLGELIRPFGSDTEAFAAINSKRLDFAIIEPKGHLVIAVEHQGSGHHQNAAFMGDAIKREVMRKAGVTWIETTTDTSAGSLRNQITAALGQTQRPKHAQRA